MDATAVSDEGRRRRRHRGGQYPSDTKGKRNDRDDGIVDDDNGNINDHVNDRDNDNVNDTVNSVDTVDDDNSNDDNTSFNDNVNADDSVNAIVNDSVNDNVTDNVNANVNNLTENDNVNEVGGGGTPHRLPSSSSSSRVRVDMPPPEPRPGSVQRLLEKEGHDARNVVSWLVPNRTGGNGGVVGGLVGTGGAVLDARVAGGGNNIRGQRGDRQQRRETSTERDNGR